MSAETRQGTIRFTGARCCVFDYSDPEQAVKNMSMEVVARYGDVYRDADGKVKHLLYTWDEGYRVLHRCKKCGAFFLVQVSEYHDFSGAGDSYYTDWFQVDDEATAELINATWNGFDLEFNYDGPGILESQMPSHGHVFAFDNVA